MILPFRLIELGLPEIKPNPGSDVATVVVTLTEFCFVINFNFAFLLMSLPGESDNSDPS